jgi:hypothetical protein
MDFGISEIVLDESLDAGIERSGPVPTQGRLAIVTDAGRDAMDADVPLTNGIDADGEVVWS